MMRVVKIFAACMLWQLSSPITAAVSTGTGFFISASGHIATNSHVVENGTKIRVRDHQGELSEAIVILQDATNDIAILKIDGVKSKPIPIRSSSQAKKEMDVFTLGFPNPTIQGRELKVTKGIVSSLSGIRGEPNSFQISVPIQPGNSGGPLIDMTGAVIGITTAKLSAREMLSRGGQLPENVNYAVKSNYLLELLATDNFVGLETILASNETPRPLTSLIDSAQKSVVYIVVTSDEAETNAIEQSKESVPKYVADAQALKFFRLAEEAAKKGDNSNAIFYYGEAANLGNEKAQSILGQIYTFGKLGVSRNVAEAVKWFRKAAEQGDAYAQAGLGIAYVKGEGVPRDEAEGVRWLRKAAEQGNATAQSNLGVAYMKGMGVPKDEAEAVRWFRKAAEQGDAYAQAGLGIAYMKGMGVPKDEAEAVRWLRKAAEQGNATAQSNLGVAYMKGMGVPKDEAEAVRWFRKAAEQGDAYAQAGLGIAYVKGGDVPRDVAEGVRWLRKAAEQGNATAQRSLGLAYVKGEGVPRDVAEGVRWLRKAAEQGDATAQSNLGLVYMKGMGVPKDEAEAVRWFRKAAEQGIESAKSNLLQLER